MMDAAPDTTGVVEGPPASAYAGRLLDDGLVVFLLHGVVEDHVHPVRNYTRKHISARRLEEILSALCAAGAPVSMDRVLAACEGTEALPPRAFAITFDDGFENNASIALPVLRAHGVPATIYVTTGFVERNRMSWIDRIEWAFAATEASSVRLPWGERPIGSDAEQIAALAEIRRVVKTSPDIAPDAFASDVQAALGVDETWSSDDPLDRKLTWDGVRRLARDPLISVGGHTHNHAILAFLSDAELADELDLSMALLAEKAGVSGPHYSYPEGLWHTFDERVIAALRRRGVRLCPTAEDGVNAPPYDAFRLHRVNVV